MVRMPAFEADNGANGNAETARVADRFRAADDKQREWLNQQDFKNRQKKARKPKPICSGPECTRFAVSKGLCDPHRVQLYLWGEMKPLKTSPRVSRYEKPPRTLAVG